MKFVLEIELNADTMKTGHNVAAALVNLARSLLKTRKFTQRMSGDILDHMGNVVGSWKVIKP